MAGRISPSKVPMQVENLGTDYCKVTGAHRSPLLNHILIGSSVLQSLLVCGGSVAEWLACWAQAQKGPDSNRSRDAVG